MYEKLPLRRVLFVYSAGSEHYIEKGIVRKGELTSISPLSVHDAMILASDIIKTNGNNAETIKELLPKNVIYFSNNIGLRMSWYELAPREHILFSDSKLSGTYNMPNILYCLKNSELTVWAFLGSLNEESVLYRYPLPNMYISGAICNGNVKLPKSVKPYRGIMDAWHDRVWNSVYENTTHTKNSESNLFDIFTNIKDTHKPFPSKELIKAKLKIGDVI